MILKTKMQQFFLGKKKIIFFHFLFFYFLFLFLFFFFRTKASEIMSAPLWEIDEDDIKRGKLLAQGTNATVYIGEFRGQKVAIKVLKAPQDPVQMKDFQTEFDILRHFFYFYFIFLFFYFYFFIFYFYFFFFFV